MRASPIGSSSELRPQNQGKPYGSGGNPLAPVRCLDPLPYASGGPSFQISTTSFTMPSRWAYLSLTQAVKMWLLRRKWI